ncbi:MAG: PQQ-like beta-propeller repeat protein [bacterium]|nr:PQQ-like beta-propeller repeat protein [bacterium]
MHHGVLKSRFLHGGTIALAALALLPAAAAAQEWPSFRGPRASGIADGQNPPVTWDAEQGTNIRWRTPIPGLGHSSPIVWGDRLFLTSAVSTGAEPYLRVGLYGESPDHPEDYVHHYRLYCLDKSSGKILWERTAHSGKPQVKRHIKSSHASSTPATDGKRVVVSFGSEGLYAYDFDGNRLWKVDLGYLDAGAFNAPEIQWGYGSSPIIYKDRVIVLCDVNNQSFVAAFDVETGGEIWRTPRDEMPTWGTPTIAESDGRTQLIVNGFKHIGGYDVATGRELWRLRGGGDVPVPTPVVAHGLVFLTNAHGPMAPIYAIRLDARGDVSLAEGEDSNEFVAWSRPRRGAYMPTPIVYGENLYVATNSGVLTVYQAKTGQQLYRTRLAGRRGAYSASPVAADGRLYFTDEYCDIHVVKAAAEYVHLATNPMDENCLATPAISDGTLFVRTSKQLVAIAESGEPVASGEQVAVRPRPPAPEQQSASTAAPAVDRDLRDEPTATGELTDPMAILKRAEAAAAAVEAVKYDVGIEGFDAAKAIFGSIRAAVTATGVEGRLPAKFLVEAEVAMPGAAEPMRFTAGSDGNMYYAVDHRTKTAHEDLEWVVMGPFLRIVRWTIVREFHRPDPLVDEINSQTQELRGSKRFAGEDCYELHVVYSTEPPESGTWYYSKRDFLLRGGRYFFTVENGEKAGVTFAISNLAVEPKLDPELFSLKLPAGYTLTDESAP